MPIGYLITVALIAVATSSALAPLRQPKALARFMFGFAVAVNELPFAAFFVVAASTLLAFVQSGIDSAAGWATVGVAIATTFGLSVLAWRGWRARQVLATSLTAGLGDGWRTALDATAAARLRRRVPFARILFGPVRVRSRRVERISDVRYGDAGVDNLLDIYRQRSHPRGSPVLIYVHGGSFVGGGKSREARPLVYRLAGQGWVCVSANYHLGPVRTFPQHLIDVKKVIGWVREHGIEFGADPDVLFIGGSSAGGHLASMAALTANDPALQPGFEEADTSVTAAVCLSGYYGYLDAAANSSSSPRAHLRRDAPPFFLGHGDMDTVVPVEGARSFADGLRRASDRAVVYAELPGALHSFDLFHSLRFEAVVDAIEAFAASVTAERRTRES